MIANADRRPDKALTLIR
ncbi:hypothetical protein [Escherichia coli]|nr:hypothetical protein [Escherichia coli]MCM4409364.1 hypothetical protein [Escherichia coli]